MDPVLLAGKTDDPILAADQDGAKLQPSRRIIQDRMNLRRDASLHCPSHGMWYVKASKDGLVSQDESDHKCHSGMVLRVIMVRTARAGGLPDPVLHFCQPFGLPHLHAPAWRSGGRVHQRGVVSAHP